MNSRRSSLALAATKRRAQRSPSGACTLLLFLAALGMAIAVGARSARACSCVRRTLVENVESTPLVVEATYVEVEDVPMDSSGFQTQQIRLRVDHVFKSELPGATQVTEGEIISVLYRGCNSMPISPTDSGAMIWFIDATEPRLSAGYCSPRFPASNAMRMRIEHAVRRLRRGIAAAESSEHRETGWAYRRLWNMCRSHVPWPVSW